MEYITSTTHDHEGYVRDRVMHRIIGCSYAFGLLLPPIHAALQKFGSRSRLGLILNIVPVWVPIGRIECFIGGTAAGWLQHKYTVLAWEHERDQQEEREGVHVVQERKLHMLHERWMDEQREFMKYLPEDERIEKEKAWNKWIEGQEAQERKRMAAELAKPKEESFLWNHRNKIPLAIFFFHPVIGFLCVSGQIKGSDCAKAAEDGRVIQEWPFFGVLTRSASGAVIRAEGIEEAEQQATSLHPALRDLQAGKAVEPIEDEGELPDQEELGLYSRAPSAADAELMYPNWSKDYPWLGMFYTRMTTGFYPIDAAREKWMRSIQPWKGEDDGETSSCST